MTKLFITTFVGCSLLIATQALANINTNKTEVKKAATKIAPKAQAIASPSKKNVKKSAKAAAKGAKKTAKKAKSKVVRLDFEAPQPKEVVHLDFDTQPIKTEKAVLVAKAKAAQLAKPKAASTPVQVVKTTMPAQRKPASLPKPITVAQLKKTTKPYWAAYCRDGIVLNSHVYCALKNPQRQGLKAAKQVKVAALKDSSKKSK